MNYEELQDTIGTARRVEGYAIDIDRDMVAGTEHRDVSDYTAIIESLDAMYPFVDAQCLVRGSQIVFAYDEDGDVSGCYPYDTGEDWTYGIHQGYAIFPVNHVGDDEAEPEHRLVHMVETGTVAQLDQEGNKVVTHQMTYFLAGADVVPLAIENAHSYDVLYDDPVAARIDTIVFDEEMPIAKKVDLLQQLFIVPNDITVMDASLWNQRLSYLNSLGFAELCHVLSTMSLEEVGDGTTFADTTTVHGTVSSSGGTRDYLDIDHFDFVPEIKRRDHAFWATGRRRLGAVAITDNSNHFIPLFGDVVVGDKQAA